MTITLVAVLMIVAAIGSGQIARARRTITPRIPPPDRDPARDLRVAPRERLESALPSPLPLAQVAQAEPSLRQGGYPLSGPNPGGLPDRTAALLATMSGPGLCTPRDG